MKKNYYLALFASVLMFFGALQTFAQVYTISFTGSGESATVESVEAQNVTQGISTTVPSGDVLVLNVNTALNPLSAYSNGMQISSNSAAGTSTVSFYAKQAGNARISVYSMDGRKIASLSQNLLKGTNSFQVSLRTGAYVISVQGAGYALSGKMISVSSNNSHPEITFLGVQEKNTISPVKSAEASVSLWLIHLVISCCIKEYPGITPLSLPMYQPIARQLISTLLNAKMLPAFTMQL